MTDGNPTQRPGRPSAPRGKTPVDIDEDLVGEASEQGPRAHWDEVKTGDDLETYIEDIAETVRIGLDQSIAILTPWFFKNMPRVYYQTTPRPEKVRHLSAIITGHVFETKQTIELWDRDRSKVTYIGPGGDRFILVDMARRIAPNPLKMGSLYFSRDKLLFLSTFHCSEPKPLDRENRRIMEKVKAARALMIQDFGDEGGVEDQRIDHFLKYIDNDFVMYATAGRIQTTYRMVHHMQSHEGAHTFFEPIENSPTARLTLGMKNAHPAEVIEAILHLFNRYEYTIIRAFIAKFSQGYDEPISVMHFIVGRDDEEKIDAEAVSMMRLNKALRTLGWVDVDEYAELTKPPYSFSINAGNLIRAVATWSHVMLGKENPYYYSQYKIRTTLFKYADFTRELVQLFRMRFDPLREKDRKAGGYEKTRTAILAMTKDVIDEVEKAILHEAVNFMDHTLKTNYFLPTKTGLAFRIAPEALNPKYYPMKPFGIFFVVGKDYRFFQMRWKDISRGGLRVVMPRNASDYDYALAGLFDEVYGLSFAQQLKNKDIPEGGSKAVLVLKPGGHRQQAVRGAVNAMLDLLVARDESDMSGKASESLVSYYDKEEIIYLGPDENITNDLIEWVPMQAERRGYRYAAAFMSSKPGAGINHKEYGVTSEGLNVYLDNMLRHLGINPKTDRFTVKITGGPDGDVAGNELKILHREYGENARVVAVADGFGAAYDPDGLNWKELLRLFKESKSIAEFDPKALSKRAPQGALGAFVIKADTAENVRTRNNLHFTAKADVFIPAGGRPYTVNEKNWMHFLGEGGVPTCRAVVEGANIFFTAEAREQLQKKGLLMIKDSSANKTGVICSSYEIIASLTLSNDEFLTIKNVYVPQVIEILRHKADQEAKLLFQEFTLAGGRKTLVELSMAISRQINDVTDVMLENLTAREAQVLADPMYQELIYQHVPRVLVDKYRERLLTRLPLAHQIAILAAYIASYIVYREGLSWLDQIPPEDRFAAATTYMRQDLLARKLVESVETSSLTDKERIASILRMSAARDLTILEMEKRPTDGK
jgi:glutamate dehydrogenase